MWHFQVECLDIVHNMTIQEREDGRKGGEACVHDVIQKWKTDLGCLGAKNLWHVLGEDKLFFGVVHHETLWNAVWKLTKEWCNPWQRSNGIGPFDVQHQLEPPSQLQNSKSKCVTWEWCILEPLVTFEMKTYCLAWSEGGGFLPSWSTEKQAKYFSREKKKAKEPKQKNPSQSWIFKTDDFQVLLSRDFCQTPQNAQQMLVSKQ